MVTLRKRLDLMRNEYEPNGDDDEFDDGDEGGPGPSGGKVSKKPHDAPEGIFDDKDPEEMTLQ